MEVNVLELAFNLLRIRKCKSISTTPPYIPISNLSIQFTGAYHSRLLWSEYTGRWDCVNVFKKECQSFKLAPSSKDH